MVSMSFIYKKSAGFTIVELLIVIVVIAILATISIVAYNGIQNRAYDTTVQNDLSNLSKKFELFYVDNDRYPNVVADLNGLNAKMSKDAYLADTQANLVPCHANSAQEYSVAAISKSGKRFYVSRGGNIQEYTGATSWSTYQNMCTSTLSGSAVIGSGSGWYQGVWRVWTDG